MMKQEGAKTRRIRLIWVPSRLPAFLFHLRTGVTPLAALALLACAGGTSVARGPREPTRVETEAPPPPPPIDPLALVPEGVEAVALVRAANVRGTVVAPAIEAWLRSEGVLASMEASGIDPLRDIDELVIAGRTGAREPDVVVLDHRVEEARLVQSFDHLNGSSGARVEEREGHRIAVAASSPARLLLASPTVAVLASEERMAEVTSRLRARSPRIELVARLEALGQRAPDLAGTAAILAASGPPSRWNAGPGHLGLPRPGQVGGLASFTDGAAIFVRAGYGTELEAEECERNARAFLSGSSPATLIARLMGLGRALREARVDREGADVFFRARLEPDEVTRIVDRLVTAASPGPAP